MACFIDSQNREWNFSLNVAHANRVRAVAQFNILDAGSVGPLCQLRSDPVKLGETLWTLCREQAEARGVSQDDFYRGLDGDALESGWRALLAAFEAFAVPAARPAIEAAVKHFEETMIASNDAIAKSFSDPGFVANVNDGIDRFVRQAMSEALAALDE